MEFPYYVINEQSWQVLAGCVFALDAERLLRIYRLKPGHYRVVEAHEVHKHHEAQAATII